MLWDFDYASKKLRIKVDTYNYDFLTRFEWFLTKEEAIQEVIKRKETQIRQYKKKIENLENLIF